MTEQQKQSDMITASPIIVTIGGNDYVIQPAKAGQIKAVMNWVRDKWKEESTEPILVVNREVQRLRSMGIAVDKELMAEMSRTAIKAASSPTRKLEPNDHDIWDMMDRIDVARHVLYMFLKFSNVDLTEEKMNELLPDDDSVFEVMAQVTANAGKSMVSEEPNPKKD